MLTEYLSLNSKGITLILSGGKHSFMAAAGHVQKASSSGQRLNESAPTSQLRAAFLGQLRVAEGGELCQLCVLPGRS